jgi:hypothetical protein
MAKVAMPKNVLQFFTGKTYRPCIMPVGMPVSHDFWEFHGRSDILSSLVVAQPEAAKRTAKVAQRSKISLQRFTGLE